MISYYLHSRNNSYYNNYKLVKKNYICKTIIYNKMILKMYKTINKLILKQKIIKIIFKSRILKKIHNRSFKIKMHFWILLPSILVQLIKKKLKIKTIHFAVKETQEILNMKKKNKIKININVIMIKFIIKNKSLNNKI